MVMRVSGSLGGLFCCLRHQKRKVTSHSTIGLVAFSPQIAPLERFAEGRLEVGRFANHKSGDHFCCEPLSGSLAGRTARCWIPGSSPRMTRWGRD